MIHISKYKKLEKNTQTLLRFQTLVAFTLEVNCIETEKKEWLAETERGWVIGDVTMSPWSCSVLKSTIV